MHFAPLSIAGFNTNTFIPLIVIQKFSQLPNFLLVIVEVDFRERDVCQVCGARLGHFGGHCRRGAVVRGQLSACEVGLVPPAVLLLADDLPQVPDVRVSQLVYTEEDSLPLLCLPIMTVLHDITLSLTNHLQERPWRKFSGPASSNL